MSYKMLSSLDCSIRKCNNVKVYLFFMIFIVAISLSGCSNSTTTRTLYDSEDIKNSTHYCINCGDEVLFEESAELYPYGFYLIEK